AIGALCAREDRVVDARGREEAEPHAGPSPRPAAASARRDNAPSSAPASPLTPTAPTLRSPSNAATPPWKNVKNGSKLASSAGRSFTFPARSRGEGASLPAAW